jgi:hypothetical protein
MRNPIFMKPLFYFGTKFNEHGHFIYNIQKGEFENTNFKFPHYDLLYKCNDNKSEKGYNTKGDYSFHQKDNFTILSINGSIADDRFGTVTSFYIEEWQPISYFIEILKINKMAIEILNKLKEKYPNGLFFYSFCL